jgi:hypothetical protein
VGAMRKKPSVLMFDEDWEPYNKIKGKAERKAYIDKLNEIYPSLKIFYDEDEKRFQKKLKKGNRAIERDSKRWEKAGYSEAKYLENYRKSDKAISKNLRFVFFTPLSIVFRIISNVAKIIGIFSSIGVFYGIYNVYKVVLQLNEGMPLAEITHKTTALIFIIFPFVALAVHWISKKLADYFYFNS